MSIDATIRGRQPNPKETRFPITNPGHSLYSTELYAETETDLLNPRFLNTATRVADVWPKHDEWSEDYDQGDDSSWGPNYETHHGDRVWRQVPTLNELAREASANGDSSALPQSRSSLWKKAHDFFWRTKTRKALTAITTIAGVSATVGIVASKFLSSSGSDPQEGSQGASHDPSQDACINAMLSSALTNFTHTVTSLSCVNPEAAKAVALTVNQTFCSTAGAVGIFVTNTLAALGLPLAYYNRSAHPNELPPSQLTREEIDAIIARIEKAQDDAEEFCEPDPSSSVVSSSLLPSTLPLPTPSPLLSITNVQSSTSSATLLNFTLFFSSNSASSSISSNSQALELPSSFPLPTPSPTLPISSVAFGASSSGSILPFSSAVQASTPPAPLPTPSPSFEIINATTTPSSITNGPIRSWTLTQTFALAGDWDIASSSSGQYLVAIPVGGGLIYTSSNYGATWIQVSALGGGLHSIASSSSGQYLAVVQYFVGQGGNGHTFVSSNYGATWIQTSASGGYGWFSIASSSSGQYLTAVSYDPCGCTLYGGNYISTSSNYGATWTQTGLPPYSCVSVTSSISGQYLAAGQYGGTIYTSSDYGITWIPTSAPYGWEWFGLASSSSGQYLVASQAQGSIYVSSNYGANWTKTSAPYGSFWPIPGSCSKPWLYLRLFRLWYDLDQNLGSIWKLAKRCVFF